MLIVLVGCRFIFSVPLCFVFSVPLCFEWQGNSFFGWHANVVLFRMEWQCDGLFFFFCFRDVIHCRSSVNIMSFCSYDMAVSGSLGVSRKDTYTY